MKKSCIILIVLLTGLCTFAQLGSPVRAEAGVIKSVVLYIPNRVFDLLDIVRFRVRVGPGLSAGVRATKLLSAYAGMHSSLYVGLRGPRGEKEIPWPMGFDNRAGAQISLADATTGGTYYDPLEVGFEVQPLIAGVNIGIGVYEILDFFTGFVFIDLQNDDYGKDLKTDVIISDKPDEKSSETDKADAPETYEPKAVETGVIETETVTLGATEPEVVDTEAVKPETVAPETAAPETDTPGGDTTESNNN